MSTVDDIQNFGALFPEADNLWLNEEQRSHLWSELRQGLREMGDIEGAIDALQQATQYKHDNSLAWYRLAMTLWTRGDLHETELALINVRWESYSRSVAEYEEELYGV